eukprot:30953-Amphidinium_carterae.1
MGGGKEKGGDWGKGKGAQKHVDSYSYSECPFHVNDLLYVPFDVPLEPPLRLAGFDKGCDGKGGCCDKGKGGCCDKGGWGDK